MPERDCSPPRLKRDSSRRGSRTRHRATLVSGNSDSDEEATAAPRRGSKQDPQLQERQHAEGEPEPCHVIIGTVRTVGALLGFAITALIVLVLLDQMVGESPSEPARGAGAARLTLESPRSATSPAPPRPASAKRKAVASASPSPPPPPLSSLSSPPPAHPHRRRRPRPPPSPPPSPPSPPLSARAAAAAAAASPPPPPSPPPAQAQPRPPPPSPEPPSRVLPSPSPPTLTAAAASAWEVHKDRNCWWDGQYADLRGSNSRLAAGLASHASPSAPSRRAQRRGGGGQPSGERRARRAHLGRLQGGVPRRARRAVRRGALREAQEGRRGQVCPPPPATGAWGPILPQLALCRTLVPRLLTCASLCGRCYRKAAVHPALCSTDHQYTLHLRTDPNRPPSPPYVEPVDTGKLTSKKCSAMMRDVRRSQPPHTAPGLSPWLLRVMPDGRAFAASGSRPTSSSRCGRPRAGP